MEVGFKDGKYYKPCPVCNRPQGYKQEANARRALKLKIKCHKCRANANPHTTPEFHRGIRVGWYNRFIRGADIRGIAWDLTIDDVADLYEKQEHKCVLTGADITFPTSGHPNKCHASIDRIDNKKGYTADNIQLILGAVNLMRGRYSLEEFVKICCQIAEMHALK